MTNPTIDPISYNAGIEAAKKAVAKRRDDYVAEHGNYDPSTGATEFPGNGDEYVGELDEIEELIGSLHRTEPQTAPDDAPTRDELWTAIRDRDARINSLYAAMKVAKEELLNDHPNWAMVAMNTALKDRQKAAPADAERLALAEIKTDQLETVDSILATLDRYTDSIQGKNDLKCGILMANYAMLEAAKIIRLLVALRAGGWREDMQS